MCTPRQPRSERSGNIAVFACVLMVVMLSVVALAVDIGYLNVVDSELQRSADASAMAAAWKLLDYQPPSSAVTSSAVTVIECTARQYAALNAIGKSAPVLGLEDAQVGYLAYPFSAGGSLSFSTPSKFNAVAIRVRRTDEQNGAVGLFFARVMGRTSASLEAAATAAFLNNVVGFRVPQDGSNLDILPITVYEQTWNALMAGTIGTDQYAYSPSGAVCSGSDGLKEIVLYPDKTGSPGNCGTVDIGSADNSTQVLSRQIRQGLNKDDLAYYGGQFTLNNAERKIHLNGDSGMSVAIKDDVRSIIGQVKVIPVYESVVNPGNTAQYTIVKWVGVRIMDEKLVGENKHMIIQPAKIVAKGGIGGETGTTTSNYVYSPVWLVK